MAQKMVRKKAEDGVGYVWDFASIEKKEISTKAKGYRMTPKEEVKEEPKEEVIEKPKKTTRRRAKK